MPYFSHATATIDEGASIGSGTQIWHYTHIMPKAQIGQNCKIGQNVFIDNHVCIGNNVKIQNNVSIYQGVILEDDVFCGPSMVFTNIKTPRSAYPRNNGSFYLTTRVKKGVSIGANATIVCGNTIDEQAFIAAGSVITSYVKPYALMVGVPAKQVGWACECGERLAFEAQQTTCQHCSLVYLLEGATCRRDKLLI
jgi:UDP-2-acetamido-3-amino-2,3-dideoxy-glucuronate N-acetyltransferase